VPKVSVILPVYNSVKYLRESVESLAGQTFRDFEVIIVDDGCYDGSERLIDVYSKVPNIRVIKHVNNLGLGESLNDGLSAAAGEYIAIQHADDISLPERLEKEVTYLDSHPEISLVGTWTQYIDADGVPKKKDGWWLRQVKRVPDNPEVIAKKLLEMNCLIHSSVMFRKSVTGTVGFYDESMVPAEDWDYWLRISEKHSIGIIREVLTRYRHHHNQLSKQEQKVKECAALALSKARKRRGI
jgi:glycosyltransferase involved in cell wall biosynthesis